MRECTLDCLAIADPEEFHDALVEALVLPNWYGTNLDALYDCLTAITEETKITLVHFENFSERYPGFRKVFRDAAQANPRIQVAYV